MTPSLSREPMRKRNLRFVIIPKCAHPWADEVHEGAKAQASLLSEQLGIDVVVDYLAPSRADVEVQNSMLESAAATRPDGIAVDPVDAVDNLPSIAKARQRGMPIILFDSPSPEPGMTSVGNDFAQQGTMAAERLAGLIGGCGKVAIMRGCPSAPNHKQRYEAQVAVLKAHAGISLVDGGSDNDDIETAERQAAAVLGANPDLRGYLCCDAAGPIGIAAAVRKAGRIGDVAVVGIDAIRPILAAVKEGILDSSAATIPAMQGSMSVLMLWQATLGVPIPRRVDTGIDLITPENVDAFLARTQPLRPPTAPAKSQARTK
jgi:ribose transport system substrate-binding protein